MESIYDNSSRVRCPIHFKITPPPETNTHRLKALASQCLHKPMQKVEFYHSMSIPKSLDHALRGYLIKCGDCLAMVCRSQNQSRTVIGRIVHILKATAFDGEFETFLSFRPFIKYQNKWWANNHSKFWLTTPNLVTHTVEVALTYCQAKEFESKPNAKCIVLAGNYERDDYGQIHATPFTVARNPQQWQYWQRICDARIVWACEKRMAVLAKQLVDANEAFVEVKSLLDLALDDVDKQNKRFEELLKRVQENDKRLKELFAIQEEEKEPEEVVEYAANELQMVLYV